MKRPTPEERKPSGPGNHVLVRQRYASPCTAAPPGHGDREVHYLLFYDVTAAGQQASHPAGSLAIVTQASGASFVISRCSSRLECTVLLQAKLSSPNVLLALDDRLTRIEADDQPELHSLATGIRRDQEAVTAGLVLPLQFRRHGRQCQYRDDQAPDVRSRRLPAAPQARDPSPW